MFELALGVVGYFICRLLWQAHLENCQRRGYPVGYGSIRLLKQILFYGAVAIVGLVCVAAALWHFDR